jgi:tRNA G10  N-methylase Trm11
MKKNILCNENGKETFTKIDDKSINAIITSPPYEYRRKRLLPRIRCIISKVLKN